MEIQDLNVLVVDDEEPIRQIVVDFFTMFGAKIFTAEDGVKAIRDIFNKHIDLIISDNDMPEMTGMELLLEIKKCGNQYVKNIPIVIMSGYDIKQEAEIAGADAFLQKPFSLSKLKEMVEKL